MHALIAWIDRQPSLVAFCVVELAAIFATILAPLALRPTARRVGLGPKCDSISDAFKTVVTFIAILLSFSLVQAYSTLRSLDEMTVREANAVANVDRSLLRSDDARMAALRPVVIAYARTIAGEEWDTMAAAGRDRHVDAMYRDFSNKARSIEPATPRQQTIFVDIVRGLDDVSDLRETRLAAATTALPDVFWNVVASLLMLLLMLSGLLEPTADRLIGHCGMLAALGFLFTLVAIIDVPFAGDTAIKPTAMLRAIASMASRG